MLSTGIPEDDEQFFAVLSADGKPPSCEFRNLTYAVPFDACEPLTVDVTDAYVLVTVSPTHHLHPTLTPFI